jgi:hypothetical protein
MSKEKQRILDNLVKKYTYLGEKFILYEEDFKVDTLTDAMLPNLNLLKPCEVRSDVSMRNHTILVRYNHETQLKVIYAENKQQEVEATIIYSERVIPDITRTRNHEFSRSAIVLAFCAKDLLVLQSLMVMLNTTLAMENKTNGLLVRITDEQTQPDALFFRAQDKIQNTAYYFHDWNVPYLQRLQQDFEHALNPIIEEDENEVEDRGEGKHLRYPNQKGPGARPGRLNVASIKRPGQKFLYCGDKDLQPYDATHAYDPHNNRLKQNQVIGSRYQCYTSGWGNGKKIGRARRG